MAGKFKKGESGNPAGKPKGAKNKVTLEVKEKLAQFMETSFDEFVSSFNRIKRDDVKAKIYLEAAKLVLPRPKDEDEEEESNRRAREILDRIWPINRD
jgi:hypothetical protein